LGKNSARSIVSVVFQSPTKALASFSISGTGLL
jgi:hypothetical protein